MPMPGRGIPELWRGDPNSPTGSSPNMEYIQTGWDERSGKLDSILQEQQDFINKYTTDEPNYQLWIEYYAKQIADAQARVDEYDKQFGDILNPAGQESLIPADMGGDPGNASNQQQQQQATSAPAIAAFPVMEPNQFNLNPANRPKFSGARTGRKNPNSAALSSFRRY